MKRVLLVLMMAVLLTGCKTTVTEDVDNAQYQNAFNQFVVVEERHNADYGTLSIMYDKDTKVMYYMLTSTYKCGLTPVYNSDGSVKIYDEDN
jgi:uncharacterized protein YceK